MLRIDIVKEWEGLSDESGIGLMVVDDESVIVSEDDQMDAFRPFCTTLAVVLGEMILAACPMPKGARMTLSHGGQHTMLSLQDEPNDGFGQVIGNIAAETALKFALLYWKSKGWTVPPMND